MGKKLYAAVIETSYLSKENKNKPLKSRKTISVKDRGSITENLLFLLKTVTELPY
jgi:hypothetical protein